MMTDTRSRPVKTIILAPKQALVASVLTPSDVYQSETSQTMGAFLDGDTRLLLLAVDARQFPCERERKCATMVHHLHANHFLVPAVNTKCLRWGPATDRGAERHCEPAMPSLM